ncbi:hypothetical protein EC991_009321 [Linnemannia zychae]|nr:hypothetical protein EC991_009321 [Linnemannia zychae]
MSRAVTLAMATALCLLATAPSTVSAFGNGNNHKKVLLRDVQTLTLHRGRMTTGRRTSPVPQIKCVGGNACGDFEPEVVQCTNAGFDGDDVQWKCQADLPDNLRFGQLDVYCEGYSHPDDPFVLKGSCGLEYKLQYTNIRHNDRGSGDGFSFKNPAFNEWSRRAKRQSWIELIYFGTWISVAGLILYSFVKNCFQHYREDARNDDPPPPYRPSGGHGSGGGGGGGGGNGGWGSGWNNNNQYKPYSSSSTAEAGGFRPGFWSGVGLGGLGAYMAANRNNNRPQQQTYYTSPSSSSSSWGSSSYDSGSYSGGGSGMGGSSSSAGSSSRPMRSATGFGGTRRR